MSTLQKKWTAFAVALSMSVVHFPAMALWAPDLGLPSPMNSSSPNRTAVASYLSYEEEQNDISTLAGEARYYLGRDLSALEYWSFRFFVNYEEEQNDISTLAGEARYYLGRDLSALEYWSFRFFVNYAVVQASVVQADGTSPYMHVVLYNIGPNLIRLQNNVDFDVFKKNAHNFVADLYANVFGTAAGNTTSFASLGKDAWTTVTTEAGRQYMFNKSLDAATRYSLAFQQKNLLPTLAEDFNRGLQNINRMPESFHSPEGLALSRDGLLLWAVGHACPSIHLLTLFARGATLQFITDLATQDFGNTTASASAAYVSLHKAGDAALKETVLYYAMSFLTYLCQHLQHR